MRSGGHGIPRRMRRERAFRPTGGSFVGVEGERRVRARRMSGSGRIAAGSRFVALFDVRAVIRIPIPRVVPRLLLLIPRWCSTERYSRLIIPVRDVSHVQRARTPIPEHRFPVSYTSHLGIRRRVLAIPLTTIPPNIKSIREEDSDQSADDSYDGLGGDGKDGA